MSYRPRFRLRNGEEKSVARTAVASWCQVESLVGQPKPNRHGKPVKPEEPEEPEERPRLGQCLQPQTAGRSAEKAILVRGTVSRRHLLRHRVVTRRRLHNGNGTSGQ